MQNHSVANGTFLGGVLLIAGCCIGAGMLGLPVLSAMAGFFPSLLIFILCWLFMVTTGLLWLEVNLWFKEDVGIVTMAEKTLGLPGKGVSWFVFLFLFYSLIVAYIAASGSLVSDFLESNFSMLLPNWIGSLLFSVLFGILIYFGTGAVDWFNRLLMLGLVLSYFALVLAGAKHVKPSLLTHQNWAAASLAIPVVIVSFGFHNLIPSLTTYFKGQVKPLIGAIFIGSAIPLLVYLIWEWLILGIVPLEDFKGALDQGEMATHALKNAVGSSWILDVAEAFAFFAIITSFLSVALSFVDFLSDGLAIKKTAQGKVLLITLVLGLPFICALLYPTIFLIALNYAGFGALILFGILPALMVWKGRYLQKLGHKQIVRGGRLTLSLIILSALGAIVLTAITL